MNRSMFGWVRATLLGSVVAGLAACGSSGSSDTATSGGASCTPGEQKACACAGGTMGVQTCASDGRSLNACECGGSSSSGSGGAGGTSTGTQMETCGDGVQQAGECDPTTETHLYCAADCAGTTSTSTGTGGAGGSCTGHVYYAGLGPDATSVWVSGGLSSLAAGHDMCQKANLGADHVCDYEEVIKAQTAGELSMIAAGTTAWVQRTTPAMVNGTMSAPGPGGRCNDWKYMTNHLSDGEYVSFETVGQPNFHLDNETKYTGVAADGHANPDDLPCGNAVLKRRVMCCYAKCD